MTHPLYEELENVGLIRDRRVSAQKVARLSRRHIIDLAEQAAQLTSADQEPILSNEQVHVASLSLGGGYSPCSELACRRKRLDELARFAAFYSDRVYIHNFIADHTEHTTADADLAYVRESFLADLRLLAHVRPLIEGGRMVPVSIPAVKCPHCVATDILGEEAGKRSVVVRKELSERYLREMEVTLEDLGGEYGVTWKGPEELLQHGGGGRDLSVLPEELAKDTELASSLAAGGEVSLNLRQRQLLGVHQDLTSDILRSLCFEMAVTQALRATFVTQDQLEIDVLNRIAADPGLARRNLIVEQHLTSLVPFAGDVPIARLLELRSREEEAFLVFRRALNKALDEYRSEGASFDEGRARQLYQDVLAPRLAQLDQKVRTAKKDIVSQLARDAGGWTAAITIGLCAGIVPAGAVAAAKLLGLTKVAADMISSGLKAKRADTAIANDEYFFLWKVRQAARS